MQSSIPAVASDNLSIDLRMYRKSGIGRYLQTLVPEVIPRLHAAKIAILCNRSELEGESWIRDPRIVLHHRPAPPFSISEQLAGLGSFYRNAPLLWVPQFNIPLAYRGKLLVTIHDLCQLAYPDTLRNGLQRWYAGHLLARVAARARAVFCVSEFTAREAQKYLGIEPGRLTVTYPTLGALWTRSAAAIPQPERPPFLLAVGNIKKHKNIGTLIAAFDLIRNRIPHDLLIVGQRSGFLNSDQALACSHSLLDGRVRFTGHVSDAELQRFYCSADALVFPSIYEGFGFPAVEAMALGCPVACSAVASLPEVVADAALLFDPFSPEKMSHALLHIVNDSSLRGRLVERGRLRAELYRTADSAHRTAAVINRVAEED